MRQGRWYPTSTLLADGRVVITAGKTQTGGINPDVEVYDNGSISSSLLNTRKLPFYPNQFVLPTGKVLIVARNSGVFSLNAASWYATRPPGEDDRDPRRRPSGAPPRPPQRFGRRS